MRSEDCCYRVCWRPLVVVGVEAEIDVEAEVGDESRDCSESWKTEELAVLKARDNATRKPANT